jgi:hypothetical protein
MGTYARQYRNVSSLTHRLPECHNPNHSCSLAEMFVGIICACMPSAAQSWRHHLPHYEALTMRIRFQLHTLRLRNKRTYPASSSDLEKNHGSTSIEGPHLDLKSYKLAKHFDLTQTKGIRTFIQGGRQDGFENDAI